MKIKDYLKLTIIILISALIWFNPISDEIPQGSWQLFVIFIGTMLGIIFAPMPLSAVALLGCAFCVGLKVLTLKQVLSGFAEDVAWLLIFAFVIARTIIKTGLAKRIAYYFIMVAGRTTLGLSYGLIIAELFLAPLIPSVCARAGGIMYPIINSLFTQNDKPGADQNYKKNLSFVTLVSFQACVISSAMFITAIASNPLIVSFLSTQDIHISWLMWAKGAIIPGLASLAIMPIIIYFLNPPATKFSPQAPLIAREALESMGRLSKKEILALIIILALIVGWVISKSIGFDSTAISLFGVIAILLCNILDWDDIASEKAAWDTFVWFGVVVMFSNFLTEQGTIKFLATGLADQIAQINKFIALPLLLILYFYLHYFFASVTVYVTVLFSTFFYLLVSMNLPVLMVVMPLAFFSSLSGGLTHYGISSAPIYFGSRVVSSKKWWLVGLVVSIVNILVWSSVGLIWWKCIGWY